MNQQSSEVLLIFVKNSVKGQVKTRLARSLGESKALEIYRKLLQVTKKVTASLSVVKQVWYSDSIIEHDIWDKEHYTKFKQQGQNLGTRMSRAFQQSFKQNYTKVVIIGSDCADLNDSHLNEAFQALDTHDVVIGPAEDGGYYLLGMTHFIPDLFEDIPWSQPTVYETTIRKLMNLSKSFHLLPALNDIDDLDDLKRSPLFSDQTDL
jgi:rSAM/selenodomain-associated transferase 1